MCRKFAEDYASLIDIYHSMPTPPRIVIMMPPHLYSSKHWQDLGQSGTDYSNAQPSPCGRTASVNPF